MRSVTLILRASQKPRSQEPKARPLGMVQLVLARADLASGRYVNPLLAAVVGPLGMVCKPLARFSLVGFLAALRWQAACLKASCECCMVRFGVSARNLAGCTCQNLQAAAERFSAGTNERCCVQLGELLCRIQVRAALGPYGDSLLCFACLELGGAPPIFGDLLSALSTPCPGCAPPTTVQVAA